NKQKVTKIPWNRALYLSNNIHRRSLLEPNQSTKAASGIVSPGWRPVVELLYLKGNPIDFVGRQLITISSR
ncbi:hypothetical protein MYX04_15560, partial [Nitrospiraceae bacterium AH_259_D15_M11_P09]|nr:hypothetical protein [Nitrospiraceae bacterium AH_259_D15_M11_P09]